MNIKNLKITSNLLDRLEEHFKWASFCTGKCKMTETKHGGVSSFGTPVIRPAVSFEIMRGNMYVMISLFQYAKGCVIHFHFMNGQIDKSTSSKRQTIVSALYRELFDVCQKNSDDTLAMSESMQEFVMDEDTMNQLDSQSDRAGLISPEVNIG